MRWPLLLLVLLAAGCAPAPEQRAARPPHPTAAPVDLGNAAMAGDEIPFILCGEDPAWQPPSREAQAAQVWDQRLRGASQRTRAEQESTFFQPLTLMVTAFPSHADDDAFARWLDLHGLWNAPEPRLPCREAPPRLGRAVELLTKGYRIKAVRRDGATVTIVAEPAPGFQWVHLPLPQEWGPLTVTLGATDGTMCCMQVLPAEGFPE